MGPRPTRSMIGTGENNLGTLPAALANRGVGTVHPRELLKETWHNEEGVVVNDLELDGFNRNGRTIANWMAGSLGNRLRQYAGHQLAHRRPVHPDYLVPAWVTVVEGVRELLLSPVRASRAQPAAGLTTSAHSWISASTLRTRSKSWRGSTATCPRSTINRSPATLHSPSASTWSTANPQMPIAASRPAANALRGQLGVVVKGSGASDHVLSNSDMDVAEVVDFLLGPEPEVDAGAGDDAE